MYEQQLLRNPDIEPANEVMTDALGSADAAYIKDFGGKTTAA